MRTRLQLALPLLFLVAAPLRAEREGVVDEADVVTFAGEATLAAPPAEVAAAMIDQRTAAGWMPLISDRHDLVLYSPTHRIEVTRIELPWPATDRYIIDEGRVEALPDGGYRLTVASVPHPDPAWLQPDLVLGTFHPSEFRLTPVDGGRRTHLAFALKASPGGALPLWLIRLGQERWPTDFVAGLRRELARRRAAAAPASRGTVVSMGGDS